MGGALGWLIHRSTHSRETRDLKSALTRQHQQLVQSQTDVSMLTDDYDDLHRKSRDEIDALTAENRQIPSLTSNLEKSQLLVRQMMQKHEAKLQDLTKKNKALQNKLVNLEEQSQIKSKLAADLDARRRGKSRQQPQPDSAALYASAESDNDPFDQVIELSDELQSGLGLTEDSESTELDDSTEQEQLLDTDEVVELDALMHEHAKTISNELPFSASNLQSPNLQLTDSENSSTSSTSATPSLASDPLAVSDNTLENPAPRKAPESTRQVSPLDAAAQASFQTEQGQNSEQLNFKLNEEIASSTLPVFEPTINNAELTNRMSATELADSDLDNIENQAQHAEAQLDGSTDQSSLFQPVNQKDDLKRIFGIGPLTEQALYELGITSYSQLADLKQHDIQRIADALDIVPARIERDDWVGNARRQLEDVLAQL